MSVEHYQLRWQHIQYKALSELNNTVIDAQKASFLEYNMNMNNPNKKGSAIEPVMLTEEWPNKQLCCICQRRADKQITTYGHADGILRIARYCDYCINTQLPQFIIDTDSVCQE